MVLRGSLLHIRDVKAISHVTHLDGISTVSWCEQLYVVEEPNCHMCVPFVRSIDEAVNIAALYLNRYAKKLPYSRESPRIGVKVRPYVRGKATAPRSLKKAEGAQAKSSNNMV